MKKEIGSEYWREEPINRNLNSIVQADYYFLGRTALKAIIIELKEQGLKTVFFPSYCCNSMLSPFFEEEMAVSYYSVDFINGKAVYDVNTDDSYDIFFATNYFGYAKSDMDKFIKASQDNGRLAIEDNTHSLFSKNKYSSDYVFGSLRKWAPTVAGGAVFKSMRPLKSKKGIPEKERCKIKLDAMSLKAEYIFNNSGDKGKFLELYNTFNEYVDKEDRILDIDDYSKKIYENLNIDFLIKRRQENADFLHQQLRRIGINTLFELSPNDCPLFVPILLRNKAERDNLKKRMIQNNIYCPIHWEKPKSCQSNIYDLELSLVCDQRYDLDDMKRIMGVIEES